MDGILSFLTQQIDEKYAYDAEVKMLQEVVGK
jgi:hypothetical protein